MMREFKSFLQNPKCLIDPETIVDLARLETIRRQAEQLLIIAASTSPKDQHQHHALRESIGTAFQDVADEHATHDYPHTMIGNNSSSSSSSSSSDQLTPLLPSEEVERRLADWQMWYTFKIFACFYLERHLSPADKLLCDKGLTATEMVLPLEHPWRDEVQHQAEQLYGQQLKIQRVTDKAFEKFGMNASVLLGMRDLH